MCVCVCVCARVLMCVCVCVFVCILVSTILMGSIETQMSGTETTTHALQKKNCTAQMTKIILHMIPDI